MRGIGESGATWEVIVLALLAGCAAPPSDPRARAVAEASSLDPEVLETALAARDCAVAAREITRSTLAIVDYSRTSVTERLWLLDLREGHARRMRVTHGAGSGELWATTFSDEPGTHATSLGLYRGAETYVGKHGRSLRLDGLDPGFNGRAREREIVVHGADYATLGYAIRNLRLGRSWGCPAVAPDRVDELVDALEGGGALFAWYPDAAWEAGSRWLHCGTVAGTAPAGP
jgi:hypothetical protein